MSSVSHTSAEQGRNVRTRILVFIDEYMTVNGWSPSYAEIANALGLSSRSNVKVHLYRLEAEGKVVLGDGPRMIRVVK